MDLKWMESVGVWVVSLALAGIIGNRADAVMQRGMAAMQGWMTTRQQRGAQTDLRVAERLASNTQRLLVWGTGLILGILGMLSVGAALLTLAFMQTASNQWMFVPPAISFVATFWFCVKGFQYLEKTLNQLNVLEQSQQVSEASV